MSTKSPSLSDQAREHDKMFHDAFEALFVPGQDAFQTLSPLARERRVGVVVRGAEKGEFPDSARLMKVRSPDEIARIYTA